MPCNANELPRRTPRLLIVPGLHDSPEGHWQSWLQAQHRDAVRVVQRDWATPELERFGLGAHALAGPVAVPHILVLSSSDPWLPTAARLRWAARWGGPVVNLGDAGHINIASGFGPLPLASHWVASTARRLSRVQCPESTSTLLEATFQ